MLGGDAGGGLLGPTPVCQGMQGVHGSQRSKGDAEACEIIIIAEFAHVAQTQAYPGVQEQPLLQDK